MKNFFLGALVTVCVLVVGGVVYLRSGWAEVRADLPPPRLEQYMFNAAVHASVKREAPEAANPVPPTEQNLIAGGRLFLGNCSGCHGSPLNLEKDDSDSLYPRIPQLAKVGTEYTEAQVFWIAKHGIRRTGMFANGKWISDQELWTMATFVTRIRNLPPPVMDALKMDASKEKSK